MARYAVNIPDVESAAKRLAAATGEQFEHRSSDYWGEYCIVAFMNSGGLRIFSNIDPMYRPHLDPPEDKVFESGFGPEQVLIDDESDDRAEAIIRSVFPDAVRIGGAAAK